VTHGNGTFADIVMPSATSERKLNWFRPPLRCVNTQKKCETENCGKTISFQSESEKRLWREMNQFRPFCNTRSFLKQKGFQNICAVKIGN
jgi:hypothetical protein